MLYYKGYLTFCWLVLRIYQRLIPGQDWDRPNSLYFDVFLDWSLRTKTDCWRTVLCWRHPTFFHLRKRGDEWQNNHIRTSTIWHQPFPTWSYFHLNVWMHPEGKSSKFNFTHNPQFKVFKPNFPYRESKCSNHFAFPTTLGEQRISKVLFRQSPF
jgi:hypothetical protein